ncbi:MAG: histidine phosphatase family protein [Lachnospiraceae bacterium]|nr:histidine phosphatase family protein [Lachnospiraceae bacterium]
MKLIFVRHAEPDYIKDSLTPKGWEEARLLSLRAKDWNVTKCYLSPQGRARDTASFSLEALGMDAVTLPFLHEFAYNVIDPVTGRKGVPWDFIPSDWTRYDCMFKEGNGFFGYPCISDNKMIPEKYDEVITGIDGILKEFGYIREGRFYRNLNAKKRYLTSTVGDNNKVKNNSPYDDPKEETVLVFFCHLGVALLMISHLINIPFESLAHGFFLPASSVTILSTEERWEDEAYFRVQVMGDCMHLRRSGEPISPAGSFAEPFQD